MFRSVLFILTIISSTKAECPCEGKPDCGCTSTATIVDKIPEKVSPILTGDTVEKKCGCKGQPVCDCWHEATMIDKLPEESKEPELETKKPEIKEPSTCDCQDKECPTKCPKEEPWQKPKIVQKLLPEVQKCDCQSNKIVPKSCKCPKLQTPCGCQTCPCIEVEAPNIVDEGEMPCDKFRFRALRTGATLPPRCNKRL